MPRIPDPYSSNLQPIRQVDGITPPPDTVAVDRAVGGLGEQISRAGFVGTDIIKQHAAADDALAEAAGRTELLRAHINLESGFKDSGGQDYGAWQQQYTDQQTATLNAAAQKIKDPERRALFVAQQQGTIVSGAAKIDGLARDRARDSRMAYATDTIQGNIDALPHTSDPAVRAGLLQASGDIISALEERGDISRVQGVEWRQKTAKSYARDAVAGMPPEQIARFGVGQKTGTAFDLLDAAHQREQIDHAQAQLRVNASAARADADRAVTEQRRLADAQSQQAEDAIIADAFGPNSRVTASQIAGNAVLKPEAKLRMIGVVERLNKGDPPSQVSRATTARMFQDMHLPDGDQRKITSMEPIDTAFAGGLLTREDYGFLRTNLTNYANSPDGMRFSTRVGEFTAGMKSSITKSNPLLGQLDSSGDQKFYEFQRFVQDSVDQARKDGKNPDDLINPGSPAYLGRDDVLARFKTPLAESAANISRNLGAQSSQQAQQAQDTPGFWGRIFGTSAPPPATPAPAPQQPAGPMKMTQEEADAAGIPTFAAKSDPGYTSLPSGQPFRSGFDGTIRHKP